MLKSFKDKIQLVDKNTFNKTATDLFFYQVRQNPIYREFITYLGIDYNEIKEIQQIPFLPISLFKHKIIKTGDWNEQKIFESSGTTGKEISRHYIEDILYYQIVSSVNFRFFYGDPKSYIILALLPSYLERRQSSLVYMIDHLIKLTCSEDSGFYLHDMEALILKLQKLKARSQRKIIILGVTFALLDLAEKYKEDLSDVIIMETGGMKGRREEIIRREVHEILQSSFNVKRIHSEYGMTELMSQAYSSGNGLFRSPPWMKIFIREINDPLTIQKGPSFGAINIIDLANIHSCAFIATEDLGKINEDESFEILGRLDNSDTRGCNLLLN